MDLLNNGINYFTLRLYVEMNKYVVYVIQSHELNYLFSI